MRSSRKISNEPKEAAKAIGNASKFFTFSETKGRKLRILKKAIDLNIPGRAAMEKGEPKVLPEKAKEN